MPLPAVSLYIRDHDCTLFEAREERLLGSLRRQRIILRLVDALIVTDSRLVIRVENMVTTNSLEVSGVDLNDAMSRSNYLRWALFVWWFYFLHLSSPDYVDPRNVYVENCHTCNHTTHVPVPYSTRVWSAQR